MTTPIVTVSSDPELRRTGLGGTDVARILGLSRFGGPMDVYLEKIGQAAPLIETEPMRWGKLLEDPIAREYAEKTGRKVRRAAAFLRHPAVPHFYANIDRWSVQRDTPKRVLECKTTSVFNAEDFGEEYTDQVPGDYLVQAAWYAYLTDSEQADLAVLIGGNKHRVFHIPRDADLEADMVERAQAFWDDTQGGIPPPIDGSEAADTYLRKTYRDRGTERPMDDELARLAYEYKAASESFKAFEAQKKLLANQIGDLMGNDRWAEGQGIRVVYGERQAPARTDWAKLVEVQKIDPAIVAAYTIRGEPIRFPTVTVRPA